MTSKKTLVLGASENTGRYSNLCMKKLLRYGHEVVAIGKQAGNVEGIPIQTGYPELKDIDTVTLYLNPRNQEKFYDFIQKIKPKRVIFNPGTENEFLESSLRQNGIEVVEACTLVMLSIGQY